MFGFLVVLEVGMRRKEKKDEMREVKKREGERKKGEIGKKREKEKTRKRGKELKQIHVEFLF